MTFIYQLEDILNPNKMEKSAMQLLKERLFDVRIKQNPITYDEINRFIELEKKQMIDFANKYGFYICGYDYEASEDFYNGLLHKQI